MWVFPSLIQFPSNFNISSYYYFLVSDFQDYEEELEDEGGECSSFNKDDRTMTGINNEEKIKGIIESKEFLEFFTKKSNIIERALNQEDIFSDYGFNFEEEIAKNE